MVPLFVNRKVFYLWLPRELATQSPFPPPIYCFSSSESCIPIVLLIVALPQGLRLSDIYGVFHFNIGFIVGKSTPKTPFHIQISLLCGFCILNKLRSFFQLSRWFKYNYIVYILPVTNRLFTFHTAKVLY